MRGTPHIINQSLYVPILMFGVERRLFLANVLLCFFIASMGHYKGICLVLSACYFITASILARTLTKKDPLVSIIFKRATRYVKHSHYPPVGHPSNPDAFPFASVKRG